MKTLIVYYSRTGVTKRVAEQIVSLLHCDSEEILDTKNRQGALGYVMAGRDATLKKLTQLQSLKHNPIDYDLVIIGTPIWAWTMSTPIRTFLTQYKESIPNVAFFCTEGGSGGKKTFQEMETMLKKKPLAVCELTTKEAIKNAYNEKIRQFVSQF